MAEIKINTGGGGVAMGPGGIAGGAGGTVNVQHVHAQPLQTRAPQQLQAPTAPVDVFVSYKREERARVTPMVRALEALCIDVWFDALLQPGEAFTGQICGELDRCAVQLVCWSPDAAASPWVSGEAELGRTRGVLVPVLLAPCRLPPPFNMVHTEDLSAWRGAAGDPAWQKVLAAIGARLQRPGLPALAVALEAGDANALARWRQSHGDDRYARERMA